MAARCNHPPNRLTFSGTSTEDAAVGSRFPRKVYWYSCGVCGSEVSGPKPGTQTEPTEPKEDFPEHDLNEPF